MGHRRSPAAGFTLIELLVVIAVIGILVSLLMPAVQQAREAARRTQCQSHLHQLALALHNYHEAHSILPSGSYLMGTNFPMQKGWGWGAMILPNMDQSPLYNSIDFNLGTAVDANLSQIKVPLKSYVCPSDPAPSQIEIAVPAVGQVTLATGNYVGSEGMLSEMSKVRFSNVTDGLSQTLMLGERVNQPGENGMGQFTSAWCGHIASRTGYVFSSVPHLNALKARPINQSLNASRNFTSYHAAGAHFAFGDGSVRMLISSMDGDVFQALGTASGGEAVSF